MSERPINLLPPGMVKRNSQIGVLLRPLKYVDQRGKVWEFRKGTEVNVTGIDYCPNVETITGKTYYAVIAKVYVPFTGSPSAEVIAVKGSHVLFKEIWSNTECYHDITAEEFFQKAMSDESDRKIYTFSEMFNKEQ